MKKIIKILGVGIFIAILGLIFADIMTSIICEGDLITLLLNSPYEVEFIIYLICYSIVINVVCTIFILLRK